MNWDESFRFRDCPWCGLRDADLRKAAGTFTSEAPRQVREWTALACPRCAGVTLVETKHQLQPATVVRVIPAGDSRPVQHLPPRVEEYYSDAMRALDAGIPDAAAVQLRRTLEAAAAEFNGESTGGPLPLVKLVQGLIEKGLITQGFSDVLHHVRQVGNIGAHASDERLSQETVERAMAFTTQVLRNLFEIPAELAAIGVDNEEPASDA